MKCITTRDQISCHIFNHLPAGGSHHSCRHSVGEVVCSGKGGGKFGGKGGGKGVGKGSGSDQTRNIGKGNTGKGNNTDSKITPKCHGQGKGKGKGASSGERVVTVIKPEGGSFGGSGKGKRRKGKC